MFCPVQIDKLLVVSSLIIERIKFRINAINNTKKKKHVVFHKRINMIEVLGEYKSFDGLK